MEKCELISRARSLADRRGLSERPWCSPEVQSTCDGGERECVLMTRLELGRAPVVLPPEFDGGVQIEKFNDRVRRGDNINLARIRQLGRTLDLE